MTIRKKTDRELQLEELLCSALSALCDLHIGYPWRELHIGLDVLIARAAELGVELEE